MDTDGRADLHGASNSKLLLKEETQKLIGLSFEILNKVGHGLNEKVYENSLVVGFKQEQIPFNHQRRFPVFFRNVQVGEFIPDLIAFDAVIVDTKVIDRVTDHERGQMLNYLRITKLRVGLILNFKHARLDWERVVL
jgi:GxxExxY protein